MVQFSDLWVTIWLVLNDMGNYTIWLCFECNLLYVNIIIYTILVYKQEAQNGQVISIISGSHFLIHKVTEVDGRILKFIS